MKIAMQLDIDDVLDYALSATAPAQSVRDNLYILDKQQRLVRYQPNPAQRHFRQHRTGRDLVIKARQLGFSTEIQASHFVDAVTDTVMIATLAHDADTTQKLRRMSKRFYDNLPDYLRPVRSADNATTTIYANTGSEVTIATAGSRDTGRGGTYSKVHGSEAAFWKDAEAIIAGLLQGVPAHGEVVLETTANGAQGYIYDRAMEALDGAGIWTVHFYAWWWDDGYRLPVHETLTLNDEETMLVERHGLDGEQIAWRRAKRAELGRLFAQEYPEDVRACFLTSGGSYFGSIPHLFDRLSADSNATPQEGREYVAGVDIGQSNDYTVISVIDTETWHEVELVRFNRRPMAEIQDAIIAVIDRWRPRTTLIERNFDHMLVESVVQHYADDSINVLGFNTTAKSKPPLIKGLYKALETGGLHLLFDDAGNDELMKFEVRQTPNGNWKYEAAAGAHDDTVIARALANRMVHYMSPLDAF